MYAAIESLAAGLAGSEALFCDKERGRNNFLNYAPTWGNYFSPVPNTFLQVPYN